MSAGAGARLKGLKARCKARCKRAYRTYPPGLFHRLTDHLGHAEKIRSALHMPAADPDGEPAGGPAPLFPDPPSSPASLSTIAEEPSPGPNSSSGTREALSPPGPAQPPTPAPAPGTHVGTFLALSTQLAGPGSAVVPPPPLPVLAQVQSGDPPEVQNGNPGPVQNGDPAHVPALSG
jgi:hypothetical protein